MSISTIGDLRQHFLATQNTSRLKTDLNTLVEELTTGEKSNLTEHLGNVLAPAPRCLRLMRRVRLRR